MTCTPPNPPPVVIDNGSWTIKSGFAGDQAPKLESPSTNVIKAGTVTDWVTATEIWKEIFAKLGTTPDKQPILLTEPTFVSKSDREKMAKLFFEDLNAHSLYLAKQSVLSLYATGRFDGVVVKMGHGVIQVVPCLKGFAVYDASFQFDFAGQKLDEYMTSLLSSDGITGLSTETVRDIKENHSYVSLTYETEDQSVKKAYKLPDGKKIEIGKPRFACPEALFQPAMAGQTHPGIHSLVNEAVSKAATAKSVDAATFYKTVVVTGGCSLFPGLVKRLEKELKALAPAGTDVNVITASGTTSSFIGGCLLTCLPDMTPLWVTKQMYKDSGASIVHEKCY